MDFLQRRVSESSQGKSPSPYSWSSFDSQVDASFFLWVFLTAFSVLATLGSQSGPLLPRSPPPRRKPFGQNFSCCPQGHISGPGTPHSSPHPHQAGAALAARIVRHYALARPPKLFVRLSATDPVHSQLRPTFWGQLASPNHRALTQKPLFHPDSWLGRSTLQPRKRQWGLQYVVEEVSFWPPLHTLSKLFLYS